MMLLISRRLKHRRFRWTILAATTAFLLPSANGIALGDAGGQIPMPGLCDYPFVGITGMVEPGAGQAAWYGCRGMEEAQGQYWIQGLAYYSSNGTMSSGIFGINLGVGGGGGLTGYFCIDDPYHPTVFRPAADPRPPSAWKNADFHPTPCVPLNDQPVQIPGVNQPPPQPGGAVQTPPNQFPTGAVTNPAEPNPLATENPPH